MSESNSNHRYRTDIPNIIFDLNLKSKYFCKLVSYFHGKNLSNEDWEYFYKKGVAEKYLLTQEEAIEIIRSKTPQKIKDCVLSCFWCKSTTFQLHSHHYPIKKCDGGIETVKICPNCHYEFHYLTDLPQYRIKKEYICEVIL